MIRFCEYCNEPFKVNKARVQKGFGKYCSLRCHFDSRVPKVSIWDRFWDKVEIGLKNSCWPFSGCVNNRGYGLFGINDTNVLAHRVAYQLIKGEIPDGKVVMHACDNRICCNPSHLNLGTQADNIHDMVSKGRHVNNLKNNFAN